MYFLRRIWTWKILVGQISSIPRDVFPQDRVANARGSAGTEIIILTIIMRLNRYKTSLSEANHFTMSQILPKTLKLIKTWLVKHSIVIFVLLKHFLTYFVHKNCISPFCTVSECHFETEFLVRRATFWGDEDSYALNFSCNALVSLFFINRKNIFQKIKILIYAFWWFCWN